VVAALIRRFHEAKVSGAANVAVWGTGTPRREFLFVDDLADACIHLMKIYSSHELVNIGTGQDVTIAEFANIVAATVGYTGDISFDTSRPDGTPRKLLDVSRLPGLDGARAPISQTASSLPIRHSSRSRNSLPRCPRGVCLCTTGDGRDCGAARLSTVEQAASMTTSVTRHDRDKQRFARYRNRCRTGPVTTVLADPHRGMTVAGRS
jgi:hypothetical protein